MDDNPLRHLVEDGDVILDLDKATPDDAYDLYDLVWTRSQPNPARLGEVAGMLLDDGVLAVIGGRTTGFDKHFREHGMIGDVAVGRGPLEPERDRINAEKRRRKEGIMPNPARREIGGGVQRQEFHDGGYVLHKLTGNFDGRASAWYDRNGVMLDAEVRRGGGTYPVRKNGPIWNELARAGRVHARRANPRPSERGMDLPRITVAWLAPSGAGGRAGEVNIDEEPGAETARATVQWLRDSGVDFWMPRSGPSFRRGEPDADGNTLVYHLDGFSNEEMRMIDAMTRMVQPRENPRYEPPHDAKVQRVAERARVPYSRVRRVAMEGPDQWFVVAGMPGTIYRMSRDGFLHEERRALKPGWDDASSATMGNPVVDQGRRVGVDANQVNAVLRREGVPVLLTRGKGDYYWRGSWGQPLEGAERVKASLAENVTVDQLVEAGRDAYEGWRKRMGHANPRASSGDVPKRDALVSLGAFVATLPEDEELGGEELGWVADKAIELGLATVANGMFQPSAAALRVHVTNAPMKAGQDALRVLHDGDWDSHEVGQMAEVVRRARKWADNVMRQREANPASRPFRIGETVMGIMGVDGGYAGRVVRVRGDGRGKTLVTVATDDGREFETYDFNLTRNVPPKGMFPRRNPPVSLEDYEP